MDRINIENEILNRALEALKKNVPLQLDIEEIQPIYNRYRRADLLMRGAYQGTELRFYAEIRPNVTKPVIATILFLKEKIPYQVLLIARYVTDNIAEQLKQNGIQFIDTAGNAYINQPPVYVFIKGNKPPDILKYAPMKRAFNTTGLRVIYAFLCNPGLEDKPYREIAAAADVALGTIGWLMRELKEMGYLLDMGKQGCKLVQKENLLQRWVTAYPEKLKPKLILGRFRGAHDWWQDKTLNPINEQWGGEVAAAKLTKYLKPEIITVYTIREQLTPFLTEHRLRKDQAGDIEILEKFWKPMEIWPYEDMVHPILIYADLIATGNQRNLETAKLIYDEHIIRLVRED